MKLGTVRYLIKEGFKGAWANRLMSFASIGVLVACMVVIGLAILISENISMAIGTLEKQNVVHIYLKDRAWSELYAEESETPSTEQSETESATETEDADTENAGARPMVGTQVGQYNPPSSTEKRTPFSYEICSQPCIEGANTR